jgi:hypothetical protein
VLHLQVHLAADECLQRGAPLDRRPLDDGVVVESLAGPLDVGVLERR